MYAVYIILMYYNRSLEAWIVPKFPSLNRDIRQTSLDLKLSAVGSFASCDAVSSSSNELNNVDVDTDNAGEFRQCL